jgi:hypothetical protein
MTYIYRGSFLKPSGPREYEDYRDACDQALKKVFAAGPQRPASLAKRATPDADVNADIDIDRSDQERRLRSNSEAAFQAIKKIHAAGRRPGLPNHMARGEPEVHASKSVDMVKAARAVALTIGGHRLLSANELNKAFAYRPSRDELDLPTHRAELRKLYADGHRTVKAGRYVYEFDGKGRVVSKTAADGMRRRVRQVLNKLTSAAPRLSDRGVTDGYGRNAPESSNSNWNDVHADTGATNNWRDQPEPTTRPTIVGVQFLGVPDASQRNAAVDAIKRALRKPQPLWGQRAEDDDAVQDRTADLDEDEADEDEESSRQKDPNADDSRR